MLLVNVLFLCFVFPVAVGDAGVSLGGHMGVKHPDIQVGSLEAASPDRAVGTGNRTTFRPFNF